MPIAAKNLSRHRRPWRGIVAFLATCACTASLAATPQANALRERHAALAAELADNAFRRPLHLVSAEHDGEVQGEVPGLQSVATAIGMR